MQIAQQDIEFSISDVLERFPNIGGAAHVEVMFFKYRAEASADILIIVNY
jgi:hypothetical protein